MVILLLTVPIATAKQENIKLKSITSKHMPNPLIVTVHLKPIQKISNDGIVAKVSLLNNSNKNIELIDDPQKCNLHIIKDGLIINLQEGMSYLRVNNPRTKNPALLPKFLIKPAKSLQLKFNVSHVLSNPLQYYEDREANVGFDKNLKKIESGQYRAMLHCSLYWYSEEPNVVQLDTEYIDINYIDMNAKW
jgi:hypothetical protein